MPETPKPVVEEKDRQLFAEVATIIEALTARQITLDAATAFVLFVLGCGTLYAFGETEGNIEESQAVARKAAIDIWDRMMNNARIGK